MKKISVFILIGFAAASCQKVQNVAQINPQVQLSAPTPLPAAIVNSHIYFVGNITRHAQNYTGQYLKVAGYMLLRQNGYIIFSDENGGAISQYDLPVEGPGVDQIQPGQKYILTGKFIYGGLKASNNNPYHFELISIDQN